MFVSWTLPWNRFVVCVYVFARMSIRVCVYAYLRVYINIYMSVYAFSSDLRWSWALPSKLDICCTPCNGCVVCVCVFARMRICVCMFAHEYVNMYMCLYAFSIDLVRSLALPR